MSKSHPPARETTIPSPLAGEADSKGSLCRGKLLLSAKLLLAGSTPGGYAGLPWRMISPVTR